MARIASSKRKERVHFSGFSPLPQERERERLSGRFAALVRSSSGYVEFFRPPIDLEARSLSAIRAKKMELKIPLIRRGEGNG